MLRTVTKRSTKLARQVLLEYLNEKKITKPKLKTKLARVTAVLRPLLMSIDIFYKTSIYYI